jgi:hypothetical protein
MRPEIKASQEEMKATVRSSPEKVEQETPFGLSQKIPTKIGWKTFSCLSTNRYRASVRK